MTSTSHQGDLLLAPAARREPRRMRLGRSAVQPLAASVALGVVGLVVGGHGLSWLAGLLAGGAATAWALLGRANRAEASADPVASMPVCAPVARPRATREQLDRLADAGWRSVCEIEARFGHYGHVAVGPGGVLLLESPVLEHAGDAATDAAADRELTQLRRQALAAAANLRDELHAATGRPMWVQPVIVVWSPFPAGCVQDGRCVVVSGPRLVDWLRRRPGQLGPERAADVHDVLRSLAAARCA